ncbi:AraC-like DNA-binding protein [Caldicellulosiruptor bescii]|uniref:Transcriptional regulator, AraC family n=2 Tax=Caldicellulosiruptor bescii TaxID=31899 RepID=B9MQT8_CALBD|nr:PocR ligand-binding domain-containing protein [Caldicellulosiruptor bescii]ACM60042.1 transcriptional regulator, AraC family [Caldicellulosiruptor bescii DSM 6725]PBC87455.1 AraC-like DNA-binding protein [Caldicellulosiruptor bescii]PBC90388.1 AraC-like DNA-binding protein [Caldicellulosiruptor bescii]PBD04180.1 AraC-like DNA-binding protein [Caldicellulosiruptor bescii]PBD06185.1 AraC-like DNA-binding protein [Caldicellulosiruptor bescii]
MDFKEIIKYDDLISVLDNFSYITGISANFLTADNEWVENKKKGTCEFCTIMKNYYKNGEACRESDINGAQTAQKKKGIHVYKCHMGLIEAVIPLFFNTSYIGSLFIGQILLEPPSEKMWEQIAKKLDGQPVDIQRVKESFFKLTFIDQEKLKSVLDMMHIVAKYIIDSEMIRISSLSSIERIIEYIKNHYMEEITLDDLAKMVYLSPTYLSYLFKKQLGVTFKEYLINIRLKKSKELIETTDLPIGEISKMVGIEDQNYFSRLFKRKYGVSPMNYKKDKYIYDTPKKNANT